MSGEMLDELLEQTEPGGHAAFRPGTGLGEMVATTFIDAPSRRRPPSLDRIEDGLERILFSSRWLLAPLYLGLVGALGVILIKFGQSFYDLAKHAISDNFKTVTLGTLELLDITLLANLVLIVVFAGYENFVSKIGAAQDSEDRPHWMGHVDYSGLKMKLIGSIVAISVIGLLQDFLDTQDDAFHNERWRIAIHLTFLASGVLFALMDLLAERRMAAEMVRERAE